MAIKSDCLVTKKKKREKYIDAEWQFFFFSLSPSLSFISRYFNIIVRRIVRMKK